MGTGRRAMGVDVRQPDAVQLLCDRELGVEVGHAAALTVLLEVPRPLLISTRVRFDATLAGRGGGVARRAACKRSAWGPWNKGPERV